MFTSADALSLEGRLAIPSGDPPRGGVVICHPHPQYGGSMSSKLVPAMQRALVAAGWAALRFNFRGVGRSEGAFAGGDGEVADVLRSIGRIRKVIGGPTAVVGWSCGALLALNGVAREGGVSRYVGVAPPVRRALTGRMPLPQIADLEGWTAPSLIVCGTEDPFCRPADDEELARHLPPLAEVRVVEGADHFFSARVDELSAIVAGFVTAG